MKAFQNKYSATFRRATPDNQACPPAESLARLAAGRVWPWQRRNLVDHLAHCSDCADDFHVLTVARPGLTAALETHTRDSAGLAPAWLRPGMAVAAVAVVATLAVTVLVETGGRSPVSEQGVLFASEFEPGPRPAGRTSDQDRVFTSDFGDSERRDARLFRDDFGG